MPNEGPNDARAELQSWYLHGLQPKLARAASRGAVNPQAVAALDAERLRLVRVAAPANAGTP